MNISGIDVGQAFSKGTAWLAGFLEDGATGAPSSKRLNNVLAHFVAFVVVLMFASLCAGMAWALRGDKALVMQVFELLLESVKTLIGMTILGGSATYLLGKNIERKGQGAAPAGPGGGDDA